jgi:beta-lactam-binding protein with PASTA domain
VFGAATTVILSLRSPEVKVPDIMGKDRYEAERVLGDAGLKFRVRKYRPTSEMKADTVLFQVPKGGELVKAGQTVAMDLSRPAKEGEASETVTPEPTPEEKPANQNANEANENKPRRNRNTNKNANDNTNGNSNNANRNANANRLTTNRNANPGNSNRNTNANANRPATINGNANRSGNQNGNIRLPVVRPSATPKPINPNN